MTESENSTKPKLKLFPLSGFIAVILLRIFYWIPFFIAKPASKWVGLMMYKLSSRKRNIVLTNLQIAYPKKSKLERVALAIEASKNTGLLLSEFPVAWLGNKEKIESRISAVENGHLVDKAFNEQRPVILVSPHIGNWEFLVQWVQINYPMVGLYTPSKIPQLDDIIYWARSKFGCKPFATDGKGVLNLLRNLKKGGLMVVLPDQVPKPGGGVYVPFYSKPAYTMTLLQKFAKKTNAKIIFCYCIRKDNEKDFDIKIEPSPLKASTQSAEEFALQMNQQIESIINRYPEQYVWDYKRFKQQADSKTLYTLNLG